MGKFLSFIIFAFQGFPVLHIDIKWAHFFYLRVRHGSCKFTSLTQLLQVVWQILHGQQCGVFVFGTVSTEGQCVRQLACSTEAQSLLENETSAGHSDGGLHPKSYHLPIWIL